MQVNLSYGNMKFIFQLLEETPNIYSFSCLQIFFILFFFFFWTILCKTKIWDVLELFQYFNFGTRCYSYWYWSTSSDFISSFSCSSAEGNITSYISLKGINLIFLFLILTKGAPTCKYWENMWTHDEKAMRCSISIHCALSEAYINFMIVVLVGCVPWVHKQAENVPTLWR